MKLDYIPIRVTDKKEYSTSELYCFGNDYVMTGEVLLDCVHVRYFQGYMSETRVLCRCVH